MARAQESLVGQQSNTSEQELISLSEQWMAALEQKDGATLERQMADSFYISPRGDLDKLERSIWLKNAEEMKWSALQLCESVRRSA